MPNLDKRQLLDVVASAFRECACGVLHLSPADHHPARYLLYRDNGSHRVRVYIWNLSPGGHNRPADEWRIQVTGVGEFEHEPEGETLVLGWHDGLRVFAGFDVTRHQGQLGASSSIQLREDALHQAVAGGFALHNKGNSELAIAFRPDFLLSYVANLESLHACGQVAGEIDVLSRIAQDHRQVDDREVESTIAQPRRYAVISTKRALRDNSFRRRVLAAYRQRCAMCGVQLELLEGAHILPVDHPASTDGTDNGVALCALHHRAYDYALVTFDSDFRIHVNRARIVSLTASNLAGGHVRFARALRRSLALPADSADRPATNFVNMANALRRWDL